MTGTRTNGLPEVLGKASAETLRGRVSIASEPVAAGGGSPEPFATSHSSKGRRPGWRARAGGVEALSRLPGWSRGTKHPGGRLISKLREKAANRDTLTVQVPAQRLIGVEKRLPCLTFGPIDLELEPGVALGSLSENGASG